MPYTSHGHAYGDTTGRPKPTLVARCGGPGLCQPCSLEAARSAADEITYDALCGSDVRTVISDMIAMTAVQGGSMVTEFNGVTIRVRAGSDPDLIYRDWSRAISGYIAKEVGPYPAPGLTFAQKANDALIAAANEAKQKAATAQYAANAAAKTARTTARLAGLPPMDVSDPEKWQAAVDANSAPYGSGVIRYAEMWARLMQGEIAAGRALEDVADATSHEADIEGVTGFMHGAAVSVLAACWVHGDQLRRWHNKQWGVSPDAEGTVNPAILTIGPKADA